LKLLTAEGIVNHDPNRGFFVANLSSNEARQLYRMRHLLEAEILATLEWPDKKQLAELEKHLLRMEKMLKDDGSNDWVDAHRQFRTMIFGLSPERVIVEEVQRLLRLTDRYRSMLSPNRNENRADQERHLLRALATRNRARLLSGFEADRARIEAGLLRALEGRGL
jgi:DNA-binding GntR family transcriptional regulator